MMLVADIKRFQFLQHIHAFLIVLYLSVMETRESLEALLKMRCTRYVFMYRQLCAHQ